MLILAIIVRGLAVGWIVRLAFGRTGRRIDWTMAFVDGLGGSIVGGLIASLVAGDGLALKPSGLIGSFVGALIMTLAWQTYKKRQRAAARTPAPEALGEHLKIWHQTARVRSHAWTCSTARISVRHARPIPW